MEKNSLERTTLLPRRLLFGNPERFQVRLSPDGRTLSYLAPLDGVLNIWVAPVGEIEAARPVTRDRGRGIRSHAWAHSSTHLLYLQDAGGDENWHVFAVEVEGGEARDLTPFEGARAFIAKLSSARPHEIVVSLNDRDARYPDLYLVNLESSERNLLLQNDGFGSFLLDDAYSVRFGQRPTRDGGFVVLRREGDGWLEEPFLTVPFEDTQTTSLIGLDGAGEILYLFESREQDRAALVAMATETGARTILHEDARADVSSVLKHPTTGRVQAAASTYFRTDWRALEAEIESDIAALQALIPGDFAVVSQTDDARLWVVSCRQDVAPPSYYLYDREAGEATRLFGEQPALEGAPLSPQEPLVIRARDGLELVSYLTLPYGLTREDLAAPLPLVLFVHGGPWGRDSWGFDAWGQWLANRGYAVLNVNFRGSTGFGKAFVNAGDREWGREMHDDLLDAVAWAVAEGVADSTRVGIMGGSYGGYATLVGLAFTPGVFAVGVDIVGPSNLQTLMESMPAYWEVEREMMFRRVGDPRTEAGRAFLAERSPLSRAAAIRKPLLIGQGANDPRVKRAESDQIVAALEAKAIPVTYLLYPDEGHGFARPENRLSFYAVAEGFLAEHLGGRAEGVGDDLMGSSVEVLAGTLPEVP